MDWYLEFKEFFAWLPVRTRHETQWLRKVRVMDEIEESGGVKKRKSRVFLDKHEVVFTVKEAQEKGLAFVRRSFGPSVSDRPQPRYLNEASIWKKGEQLVFCVEKYEE